MIVHSVPARNLHERTHAKRRETGFLLEAGENHRRRQIQRTQHIAIQAGQSLVPSD